MLTHLIKSINWIDAALILLFIRMIFVGVKNGFISELFKSIGVVTAVFVSLHYYSFREGILLLFKVETTHQGFDKYAAGIVAVGRGILVCSLTIFLILLTHNGPVSRMTLRSYSYKISGRAAVGIYSFLYNNLVDKLFTGQHYNAAAAKVLHPERK